MYVRQGETDKPRFYMNVEDIDAHTEKLKQAGGTVLVEKQEVPGMGWSVLAVDPENNVLGLFQPTHQPPAPAKKTPARKKKAKPAKKKSKGRRK